jgi:hypothetical protein
MTYALGMSKVCGKYHGIPNGKNVKNDFLNCS